MSDEAFICDAVRTPIGKYGGALSNLRADDLGTVPIQALIKRNPKLDFSRVDDVIYGCANQAGEDNRNIARMSSLLAGISECVPGTTVNRLCGSGMDAVGIAARAIRSGEAHLLLAGGVESMSRAPFVIPKSQKAFSRESQLCDTTIGWRLINPRMQSMYGTDSMPETAENVAADFNISREDQDQLALSSQEKVNRAQQEGIFQQEITAVSIPQKRGPDVVIDRDEHPRMTSLEALASLRAIVHNHGTVTAGNASGVNDGACALILGSQQAILDHSLTPKARILGMATAGVSPRIMGIGPVFAVRKLMHQLQMTLAQFDILEINEAFAAQALAVTRELGLPDDDPRINPNGGAIALGHPLGMSGARLITTAMYQLTRTRGRYALCSMCIGVGQGIAIAIERV